MKNNRKKKMLTLTTAVLVGFAMTCAPTFGATKNVKEETVYVITDGSGAATETIVSDHLKNNTNAKTILDESNLTDIENVKGDEKFSKDGNTLTWEAQGNDIYYQGYTDKSAPVSMDVKYYLNGTKVTGEKLQGKSGDVKIVIKYSNNTDVNGKKVPFVVMTGLIADNDTFKNVDVDNGKVINNGNKNVIVGMAVPGLKEGLDIDSDEISLGDKVTITGTADKFDCEDMMTIVTNSLYEDIDTDELDDMDLDDDIKALDKASKKLVEGTQELYDGIDYMYSQSGDLEDGVGALADGAKQVKNGTGQISGNTGKLASGANSLAAGTRDLRNGVINARSGAEAIADGLVNVQAGFNGDNGLVKGSKKIADGLDKVKSGIDGDGTAENPGLAKGSEQLADGLNTYTYGVDQLAGGLGELNKTLNKSFGEDGIPDLSGLNDKIETINSLKSKLETLPPEQLEALGLSKDVLESLSITKEEQQMLSSVGTLGTQLDALKGSVGQLSTAAANISSNSSNLRDGATSISDGINNEEKGLKKGIDSLASGADDLHSGLKKVQGGLNGDGTDKNPGLVKGSKSLYSGLDKLVGGSGELKKGAESLAKGADALNKGAKELNKGAKQLADGMTTLDDSTDSLIEGIGMLDKGSNQLKKGMSKFYKEGIKELVNMYEDDLKGLVDNLDDVLKAGKDYDHFTQVNSEMDSSVHFIYKTEITK